MTTASAIRVAGIVGTPLLVVGSIAFGQSLLGALTFQGVPTLMRGAGVPLDIVALSYLAMLPWALKFLWSPLVERYRLAAMGERRSRTILLVGQVFVVGLLVALALAGPAVPAVVIGLLAVAAIASATMDIAGDGFAVEQAVPETRRRFSAFQVGGAYLGMLAGSGGLVFAMPALGWTGSLLLIAAVIAVLVLPVLALDEPPRPATLRRPSLSDALRSRGVRHGLLAVLLLQVGPRIAQALAGPGLVDLGLSPGAVGSVMMAGSLLALPMTLLAGKGGQKVSPGRLVLLAAALQAGALMLLAGSAVVGSLPAFVASVLLFSALNAFGFVALYALLLGWASPEQPGVDFTLFQSADALIALVCGLGGGLFAARYGYEASFVVASVAAVTAACVWPRVVQRFDRQKASL